MGQRARKTIKMKRVETGLRPVFLQLRSIIRESFVFMILRLYGAMAQRRNGLPPVSLGFNNKRLKTSYQGKL